jgi:hypothetical protein
MILVREIDDAPFKLGVSLYQWPSEYHTIVGMGNDHSGTHLPNLAVVDDFVLPANIFDKESTQRFVDIRFQWYGQQLATFEFGKVPFDIGIDINDFHWVELGPKT